MRQGNVLVGKLSIDLEWLRLGSACSLSSAIVQACWKGNRQRLWTGSEQGPGPGTGPGTGTGLVRSLCAPFNRVAVFVALCHGININRYLCRVCV